MEKELRTAIKNYAEEVVKTFAKGKPVGQDIYGFVNALCGEVVEQELEIWADGKLAMAPEECDKKFIIVVSPNQSRARQNFTIAHEIGHLFLHTNFVDNVMKNEKVVFPDFYREGDSEKEYQANEFAANLLMPQDIYIDKVKQNKNDDNIVNIKAVSDYFGVSVDAAINRGKWLGVLQW